MNTAKVIQVIVTDIKGRGEGVTDDPFRLITQYFDFDGNLLVEHDCVTEERLEERKTLKMQVSNQDRTIEALCRKIQIRNMKSTILVHAIRRYSKREITKKDMILLLARIEGVSYVILKEVWLDFMGCEYVEEEI